MTFFNTVSKWNIDYFQPCGNIEGNTKIIVNHFEIKDQIPI